MRNEQKSSRRVFLKSGAAFVGGATAAQSLPDRASAQDAGTADAALARIQGARRILLKGGIVLTLDRQVGDFAQADVLIEDGKIREIRPNIAASGDVADRRRRATASSFPASSTPTAIPIRACCATPCRTASSIPDYNRDIQNNMTLHYEPADAYAGMLVDGARADRHGHDRHRRHLASQSHAGTHRRAHPRAAGGGHPRGVRLFARRWTARPISAGYRPAAPDLFQFIRPIADAGARRRSLDPKIYAFARENGVRAICTSAAQFRAAARARPRRTAAARRRIHPLHASQRRSVAADQGQRRPHLALAAARNGDGARHALDPGRARPRPAAILELRPRGDGGAGHVRDHAHGVQSAAAVHPAAPAQRRAESAAAADAAARCSNSPPSRARAAPTSTARSARSRRARRPTSSCCGPTASTSGRSTMRRARSST